MHRCREQRGCQQKSSCDSSSCVQDCHGTVTGFSFSFFLLLPLFPFFLFSFFLFLLLFFPLSLFLLFLLLLVLFGLRARASRGVASRCMSGRFSVEKDTFLPVLTLSCFPETTDTRMPEIAIFSFAAFSFQKVCAGFTVSFT